VRVTVASSSQDEGSDRVRYDGDATTGPTDTMAADMKLAVAVSGMPVPFADG